MADNMYAGGSSSFQEISPFSLGNTGTNSAFNTWATNPQNQWQTKYSVNSLSDINQDMLDWLGSSNQNAWGGGDYGTSPSTGLSDRYIQLANGQKVYSTGGNNYYTNSGDKYILNNSQGSNNYNQGLSWGNNGLSLSGTSKSYDADSHDIMEKVVPALILGMAGAGAMGVGAGAGEGAATVGGASATSGLGSSLAEGAMGSLGAGAGEAAGSSLGASLGGLSGAAAAAVSGSNMSDVIKSILTGGKGGTSTGGLLSTLANMYSQSQARGNYQDILNQANPYLSKLQQSYSDPSSYYNSAEGQALSNLVTNKLGRSDAAAGRNANNIGRAKELQDYMLAGLNQYRQGLQGSLNSIYGGMGTSSNMVGNVQGNNPLNSLFYNKDLWDYVGKNAGNWYDTAANWLGGL